MSRVYLGHPLHGAALVVIKELRESVQPAESAEDLRQFETEFRVLQMLDHPGIPKAFAFFEEDGRHYIVEEFAHGETLEAHIETRGRLQPAQAVPFAVSVLDVVEHLHRRRIIHRDLKPANIVLGRDGCVRIIDFGAVRFHTPGKAHDTVALGTPGFAAPEQYGRAQTDERADIYSVGALLHYMLTGDDPQLGTPWAFTPPHETQPDVSEELGTIVMRALSPEREHRFRNAADMRNALLGTGLASRQGPGGPRRLQKRVRTLRYARPLDYYPILETVGMSLFGMFFFAVSVPAWFAHVPLPHPLVGIWLTAHAVMHPRGNWKRLRSLTVEIYEEGLRIEADGVAQDVLFADVITLKLTTHGVLTSHTAEICTREERVRFDGAWPGFREVVDETIARAGLTERTRGLPWIYPIELNEKIYEKPSP